MNRAILIKMASATEANVFCAEQDEKGATVEKGRFSVEIVDGAAIGVIMRMWLAGAAVEVIGTAMQYGLLPPKKT